MTVNEKTFTKLMFARQISVQNSNAEFHKNSNKTGNVSITVTLKRVRVTTVAVEKNTY
jgi:hypothetical protein